METRCPKCGEHAQRELVVSESRTGTWHYHLSDTRTPMLALCGAATMPTQIPVEHWGKTPPNYHLPESWCGECAKHLEAP